MELLSQRLQGKDYKLYTGISNLYLEIGSSDSLKFIQSFDNVIKCKSIFHDRMCYRVILGKHLMMIMSESSNRILLKGKDVKLLS